MNFEVDFSDYTETEVYQIVTNTAEEFDVRLSGIVIANNESMTFIADGTQEQLDEFTYEITLMGIFTWRDGVAVAFPDEVEDYEWEA